MATSKYDNPYYEEYPRLAERGRQLDAQSEAKAVSDHAIREELRLKYSAAHRNSCPVYLADRIPFESCGSCCKAFEDEVASRTGR